MRIEQLCNLYSQIHFPGALALPGLSKEMRVISSSGITVHQAKRSCPLFGTLTSTGVAAAKNSRKRSLYGLAQRILADSPILCCEKFMERN